MTLTLRIDNLDQLPDGGPVEHTTDGRGFEIGRDPGMDWTLPDPNRFVSSRHLEVRFEGGSYMVYDVSTNGTLLNGASMRMKSPHALQNGDRFQIGHYLVVATLMEAGTGLSPTGTAAPGMSNQPSNDIWSVPGAEAVPAFDPTPRSRERLPDFGDEKIDLPFGSGSGSSPFSSEPQPAEAPDPTPGPFVDDEADSPFGPGPSELPDLPGEPPAPPEVPLAPPSAEERAGSPFGAPEHTTPPPPVKQGGFGGPQEKTPEASPSAPPQPKTPPQDTAPPAEKPKTPVTEQPTGGGGVDFAASGFFGSGLKASAAGDG
ncbi:MAG: FHA domain-containing protein [Pseudomonadota bacterium]